MRFPRIDFGFCVAIGLLLASAIRSNPQGVPDIVWKAGAHSGAVTSIAFSQDASRLASGSQDTTAIVREVLDGSLVQLFAADERILSVALSLDGTLSALGTDEGRTGVWRVDDGTDRQCGRGNAVRLWRVSDGTEVRVINSSNCSVAKFSADGQLLFTVNGGPINVWRASTGQLLHTYADAGAGPLAMASAQGQLYYRVLSLPNPYGKP